MSIRQPFDLTAPFETGITLLEASAGTGKRLSRPTAVLRTATNQMTLSAPWLAMAPDVCAMPMGPERLQVLMAPVIMWPRPESEPVMICQVWSMPRAKAVPSPGV